MKDRFSMATRPLERRAAERQSAEATLERLDGSIESTQRGGSVTGDTAGAADWIHLDTIPISLRVFE